MDQQTHSLHEKLDAEFEVALGLITSETQRFPKHTQIRISRWLQKLTLEVNNHEWKKNRNHHIDLLAHCVSERYFKEPFHAYPPDGPLPVLPFSLRVQKVRPRGRGCGRSNNNSACRKNPYLWSSQEPDSQVTLNSELPLSGADGDKWQCPLPSLSGLEPEGGQCPFPSLSGLEPERGGSPLLLSPVRGGSPRGVLRPEQLPPPPSFLRAEGASSWQGKRGYTNNASSLRLQQQEDKVPDTDMLLGSNTLYGQDQDTPIRDQCAEKDLGGRGACGEQQQAKYLQQLQMMIQKQGAEIESLQARISEQHWSHARETAQTRGVHRLELHAVTGALAAAAPSPRVGCWKESSSELQEATLLPRQPPLEVLGIPGAEDGYSFGDGEGEPPDDSEVSAFGYSDLWLASGRKGRGGVNRSAGQSHKGGLGGRGAEPTAVSTREGGGLAAFAVPNVSAEDDISIDNYLKYLDRFSREARDFCKNAPTSRLSEPSGLDLYTTS